MHLITKSTLTTLLFATSVFAAEAPTTGNATDITGALGDAKVYDENPKGATYMATFNHGDTSLGTITFETSSDGKSVTVKVGLMNLPPQSGDYKYHVHDQPVITDCASTLAHLDPFIRGQKVPCDINRPASCEVGDLSGKHGAIPGSGGTYTKTYTDDYITLEQGEGSYIGNRSVVIHLPDASRYACANITAIEKPTEKPSGSSSGSKYGPSSYWGCGLGAVTGLKFLLI